MRLILALLALAALAGCDRQKPDAPQAGPAAGPAAGPIAGVDRSHGGTPAPDVAVQDPAGAPSMLARGGKPTLVNLWATWCAPCVKELPTLERLAARRPDLAVVIVSQDMAPRASVDAFLKSKAIALPSHLDPDMKLTAALGVEVMPTTLLYGADGREIWRYVGDLDWTGPEAAKLLAEVSRAS